MHEKFQVLAEKDEWEDEEYEEYQKILQEHYNFYITNTQNPGVNYSFWVKMEEGGEFPILNSNTGGNTIIYTRNEEMGVKIDPTEEFLKTVAYGAHEAMCFTPYSYLQELEKLQNLANRMYDGKVREYEMWAIFHIVRELVLPQDQDIPELEPLAEWASQHTDMPIPFLQ